MFLTGAIVVGFILSFAVFAWYARSLPSPGKLSQTTGYSTVFYDRDGKVLYDMYKDKNRVPVDFNEISDNLKKATIAIEDKNFYQHAGFSQTGILRAMFNIVLHHRLEGGSTITQQLIKNVLLDSSRTASRKIKELILAIAAEKKYTKDQILEMYLNEAPYGGIFWGVGSAAKGYFDKEPKDLTLTECAILAGLPQNPSYYSPFSGENDAWRGRAKDVLRRMREDKYITTAQEQASLKQLVQYKFTSPNLTISAPHFVFYVKELIEKEFGSKILDQGLKIKTTLSLESQTSAEKIVKEEIKKIKDYHVGNGAAVVLDSQSGEILAMVGSYDYNDEKYGKFNVATLGTRQPGSTMKPITYALAFEKGYTPATLLMDVSTVFPNQGDKDYVPVNYDGKFKGPVQLRFALGNSLNIPAVKLLAMVGVRDFMQKSTDMGIETLAPTQENLNKFGLAITLGGGEVTLLDLTKAFSVFARSGNYRDSSAILEISDYKGKTIYKKKDTKEQKVFSPEVSFLISHILSDNNARTDAFGPNSYLNIPGKTVAVKTGTTNDKRDNWTVGYTKGVTVGVWVGNNDNSEMDPKIASGITGASPIWYRLMSDLLKKHSDGIMDKPDKVKALTIDAAYGGLPKDGGATRSEYFIDGTEPKDTSSVYKKIKISKSNGKLANEVEIRTGNYEEKEFIVFTESDPVSTDGKNRWQEAINTWLNDQKDSKFHPPGDTSDANADSVVVSIKSPNNESRIDSQDRKINIRVKIASLSPLKNVKVFINNDKKFEWNEDKKDIDENIQINQDGVYELKIVAVNDRDKQGDSSIKFGINVPWDITVTPTSTD